MPSSIEVYDTFWSMERWWMKNTFDGEHFCLCSPAKAFVISGSPEARSPSWGCFYTGKNRRNTDKLRALCSAGRHWHIISRPSNGQNLSVLLWHETRLTGHNWHLDPHSATSSRQYCWERTEVLEWSYLCHPRRRFSWYPFPWQRFRLGTSGGSPNSVGDWQPCQGSSESSLLLTTDKNTYQTQCLCEYMDNFFLWLQACTSLS